MKKKIKVGLLGEDPYDTESIKNLLSPRYPDLSFKSITRRGQGDSLLSAHVLRSLAKENRDEFQLLLLIKDSDKHETNCIDLKKELQIFQKKMFEYYPAENILLLNIHMLEALILADIENFNKIYKSAIKFSGNPMVEKHPKDFLKGKTYGTKATRKYEESHAPSVFEFLDFDTVRKNCRYFDEFIVEFEKKINGL